MATLTAMKKTIEARAFNDDGDDYTIHITYHVTEYDGFKRVEVFKVEKSVIDYNDLKGDIHEAILSEEGRPDKIEINFNS